MMAALTLYHGAPNGPSLTVLAALFEKGLDAELVPIDLARGERHGAAVPRTVEVEMTIEGEGPVLVADGEPMADSVFVACYLDETGAGEKLVPGDAYQRWECMAFCRWIIERAAPAAAFLGTRAYLAAELAKLDDAAFEAMVGGIVSEDLKQRWHDARAGAFPEDKAQDSEAKIAQAVERVEARLDGRDWLMGSFSIADLESYAWLAGMAEIVPQAFANAPRTQAWLGRVKARPSVARALALGSGDPRKAWAPGPEINRWG